MRVLVAVAMVAILCGACVALEQKGKGLQVKDLPPAVQKTVQDNLKGAEIRSIGKEKEDGVEQFEVETLLNGKSRDFDRG